jgi:hypothetical protein
MKTKSRVCVSLALLLSASLASLASSLGCSSGGGAGATDPTDEVSDICAKFVACGASDGTSGTPYTQSSCESDFGGWVPPAGCQSAIASASCGDINGSNGSTAVTTCFPTCSGVGGTSCTGDDINQCVGDTEGGATTGDAVTRTCASVCSQQGQTYTGVCGASYEGMTSGSGEDACWCK